MNINEIGKDGREDFEGDKLDQIFEGQRELMNDYQGIAQEHYNKIFNGVNTEFSKEAWEGGEHNLHTREGNYLIHTMINATIHELSEANQVLKNWKPWKQTEVQSDTAHFKEEMIDALHFFIEALLFAGMTPDEVYDIYFKKREVNKFRQQSKY